MEDVTDKYNVFAEKRAIADFATATDKALHETKVTLTMVVEIINDLKKRVEELEKAHDTTIRL